MNYYCSSFDDAPACCDSCHDDNAEGLDLMIEVEIPDGDDAIVCCTVYHYIMEAGLA